MRVPHPSRRLRDLKEVRHDRGRAHGVPVVLVSIQRTTDSNSISVVNGLKKTIGQTQLPAGYKILYSNDTTGAIRASVTAAWAG